MTYWRRLLRALRRAAYKLLKMDELLPFWGSTFAIVGIGIFVSASTFRLISIQGWQDGAEYLSIILGILAILGFVRGTFNRMGRQIDYRPATEYDDLYIEARRLAGFAKEEIIIVNRWPDDRRASGEEGDREQGYYDELADFVNAGGTLTRVLQLPIDDGDFLSVSPEHIKRYIEQGFCECSQRNHIRELVRWRDRPTRNSVKRHAAQSPAKQGGAKERSVQPDVQFSVESPMRVTILAAPSLTPSTFVIFDRSVVLYPVYEGNIFIEKRSIKMVGMFTIRDPSRELIIPFLDLYKRISAHAIPLEGRHLPEEDE